MNANSVHNSTVQSVQYNQYRTISTGQSTTHCSPMNSTVYGTVQYCAQKTNDAKLQA